MPGGVIVVTGRSSRQRVLWFVGGLFAGVVVCGLVWYGMSLHVTNLPNPTPGQTQIVSPTALSPTPSASVSTVPQSGCSDGVVPPADVDQIVCDGVPAAATNDPASSIADIGLYSFSTPSGNIFCDWLDNSDGDGGIWCEIEHFEFQLPPDPDCGDISWNGRGVWIGVTAEKGACQGGVLGNAMYGAKLPILGYGKSIAYEQWACSSAKDGLTCWNTETYHGFKLSRSAQLTW
jgi:hypothetical protein